MHSVQEQTQGTDTSQYLEERKSTETPSVAASEGGSSPNRGACTAGLRALEELQRRDQQNGLERPATQGDSPVRDDRSSALRGFPE